MGSTIFYLIYDDPKEINAQNVLVAVSSSVVMTRNYAVRKINKIVKLICNGAAPT